MDRTIGRRAAVLWRCVAVTKAWAGLVPQLFHQLRTIHVSQLSELLGLRQNYFPQQDITGGPGSLFSTQDSLNDQSLLQTTFQKRKCLPL